MSQLVRDFHVQLKQEFIRSKVELAGAQVELDVTTTGFGGKRYWFKCPTCDRRIGVLYEHPLTKQFGCRKCLDLKYKKQRYKGMVEENI